MGSVEVMEGRQSYDVDETIFVAVGNSVKKSEKTLFWAFQNFAGKKICLLHVHRPTRKAPINGEVTYCELELCKMEALKEGDREELRGLLNQYDLLLAQAGVKADKVWTAMDSVEEGIVGIVAQLRIRWLVMGGAADKYYSKKLSELKSRKAIFVFQRAPVSCHIWFACNGFLVFTRVGIECWSEERVDPPRQLLIADLELEEPEQLRLEFSSSQDVDEDADGIEKVFSSQCSLQSSSSDKVVGSSKSSLLLPDEDEKNYNHAPTEKHFELEWAGMGDESKQKAYQFAMKRWKEEDSAMMARCKAKALEILCAKKMCLRQEMEEQLAREKQEAERLKNQIDELTKELDIVQDQQAMLKNQYTDSQSMVKELEEKIITAVELLISFRKQRDDLQIDYENVTREVKQLKKILSGGYDILNKPQILEFSFLEINEATHNFDPSWKIGEGSGYGSIYRGILRHMHVVIRMLPSHGSQSDWEFMHQVEILSRVRHPSLVMLVGTCPESRSVVYEYLTNGSLNDCLACRGNSPPLLWHTRLKIATDICSALIFLHSNKPCIIHGELRPSKILLDANYACKLGALGISLLLPHNEISKKSPTACNKDNSDISIFMDPEYLETGKLTPESDIYSFGIVLLVLLTNRPIRGILKDVKCALENGNLNTLLANSAGEWPTELAKQLAGLALRCCEKNQFDRPNLASDIWSVLEALRTLYPDSTSRADSQEPRRVPSHFVCPIFQEVMKDPQIAADGYTYEGDAIRGWFNSGHNTSPMTNLKLEHCNLVPNHTLHYAILEWSNKL